MVALPEWLLLFNSIRGQWSIDERSQLEIINKLSGVNDLHPAFDRHTVGF